MLRKIFVLLILGTYVACYENASQDDWRKKGFYRPRRNNPSQNNSQNSFQVSGSQSQNRSLTRMSYSLHLENKTATSYTLNRENRNTYKTDFYRRPQVQNAYRTSSFHENAQASEQKEENSFEKSFYRNLQPPKLTAAGQQFGHYYNSQNFEVKRPVKTGFGSDSVKSGLESNYHSQNGFGTSETHSHFDNHRPQNTDRHFHESRHNQKSAYTSFGASYSHNSFGSSSSLSPSPFQSVTPPSEHVSNTGSKGYFYKAPDYLPPNVFEVPSFVDPAMAMPVPKETEEFEESSEIMPVTSSPTYAPPAPAAMAMTFPLPEDYVTTPPPLTTLSTTMSTTPFTTTVSTTPSTTTMSTTPSTTTVSTTPSTTTMSTTPSTTTVSTTPSTTTVSTTPSTTTELTTPSTTTVSTTPSTTTVSTTPSTTTVSTTPSITTELTTPSTTTVSTTPSTTTMSTTSSTTTVSTTPSTTTVSTTPSTTTELTTPSSTTMSTTPSTTTMSTTQSTTTVSTTPSTTTMSTTPSTTTKLTTPSTTTVSTTPSSTPNLERFLEDTTPTPTSTPMVTTETTHTTRTTPTTPYQAPGYLPPKRTLYDYPPPEKRLVEPVFSIPRVPAPCDCESSYSRIDERRPDSGPCVPSTVSQKTKPGPTYSYLPPPDTAGSGKGLSPSASWPMVNLRLNFGGMDINLQVPGGADVAISIPGLPGGCKTCYGGSNRREDWTQQQLE